MTDVFGENWLLVDKSRCSDNCVSHSNSTALGSKSSIDPSRFLHYRAIGGMRRFRFEHRLNLSSSFEGVVYPVDTVV